ncbi:MAG: MotA/TolQ/ExbB proton channel family protein [Taibaiella sp.]|nr:MotA/TolQ/ExbB proton channel family protein [Taibaiella sp.]
MDYTLLLQAAVDTIQQVTPAPPETQQVEQLSLWYLLKEGGPLMIPLAICSIIAIYVFFERMMAIRKAGQVPLNFMSSVRESILEGNISRALSYSKSFAGAVPRMVQKGVSRIGKPMDHIEKSMENEGKLEVYKMEKNLNILSTIAGIAPMFGFLGTIVGMIILFFNIQIHGFEMKNMAGGIYTKMVTSAVGLIIGLVAYVAYNYLNSQINKNVNKMESASNELLDILHEPVR